jgi:hypothetical protein
MVTKKKTNKNNKNIQKFRTTSKKPQEENCFLQQEHQQEG